MSRDQSVRRLSRAPRPHIDSVDLVRPLAALLVIVTHATQYFGYSTSLFYGLVLVGSQSSRHIFFFVAALVLTYQAHDRPRWSPTRFWRRRFTGVVVPYLVWTVGYFLLGFTVVHGLAIPRLSGTLPQKLQELGMLVITGAGHLYFVMVLVQFYLLFPLFLGLLRFTRGHHLLLLAAALAIQVIVTYEIHYLGVSGEIWSDINTTREFTSYIIYLVAGGVVGMHLPQVRAWVRRYWLLLLATSIVIVVAAEGWYVVAFRTGQSATTASNPFSPQYILSFLAVTMLLFLGGEWWAARQRDGWFSRLVRTASENSYGVYLSQAAFIDILLSFGLSNLKPALPWYFVVLIVVAVAFVGANLLTATVARIPGSSFLVGRAWRPVFGGPPPAGRGAQQVRRRGRRAASAHAQRSRDARPRTAPAGNTLVHRAAARDTSSRGAPSRGAPNRGAPNRSTPSGSPRNHSAPNHSASNHSAPNHSAPARDAPTGSARPRTSPPGAVPARGADPGDTPVDGASLGATTRHDTAATTGSDERDAWLWG